VSANTAKAVVLVVGVFMFAAIGIRKDQISDPFRFAWAAGVILLGLSLLADISPQVAGPLAILVLMAVYWRNRGALGSLPGLAQGSTSKSSKQPAAAG
jgi:Na+/proline symporter